MKNNFLLSFFMLFSIHSLIAQNLIVNGDFTSGSISPATSDCNFTQSGGSYYVTNNPNNIWSWSTSFTGNGNFMAVDVSATNGSVIWRSQDILASVLQNGSYRVSLRATSLGSTNQPKFHIRVKRYASNIYPYTFEESGVFTVTSVGNFSTFTFDDPYISGIGSVATKVVIEIINDQPTWWGNDLAIDDISMTRVGGLGTCTYSQPTSSISCINGNKHLILNTSVTGSSNSNPSSIVYRLTFANSSYQDIVGGDLNLTQNNSICYAVSGMGSVQFYATAPGCSNSSGTGSYTFNLTEDCNTCTSGCPNYTEGQIFGHDNSNGDNFFAHYSSNGTLFATVDGLALFPPLTRQKLISSGVSTDNANCFADGNKGSRISATSLDDKQTDSPDNILSVSPNPFTDNISADIYLLRSEKIQTHFYNSSGVELNSKQMDGVVGKNHIEIEGKRLSSGIYLLKVETESGRNAAKKVIKID